MQKIIQDVQNAFVMAGGSVGLSALFMAGLIVLWYNKFEKKSEVIGLFWYALAMLVLVINPVYLIFIEKKAPELKRDNLYLWLIPTAPVILYSAVMTVNVLKQKSKKIFFFLGLLAVIVLAVTTSYSGFHLKVANNLSYFSKDEEEIFDLIDECRVIKGKDYIKIIATDELVEDARKYSARILTVYGKELWRGSFDPQLKHSYESWQYSLYQNVNIPKKHIDEIASMGEKNGCDVIVLKRSSFENGKIPEDLSKMYDLQYENETYLMYTISENYNPE